MMSKIGIVLSGGGIRGFAHLGMLQVLEELEIQPSAISGVSAGAIVGALYAAGHSPQKIRDLLKKHSYFGWSSFLLNKDGLFSMKVLQKVLQSCLPDNSFESLSKKLYITATDYANNEAVTFSKGKLIEAVIASASVPVIFEPVKFDDRVLVDGGLLNNFPVEPLEKNCDVRIGCYVNSIPKGLGNGKRIGKMNMIEKCFHMAIAPVVYSKVEKLNLFIEPDLHAFGMFDVNKADQIYEAGYQAAMKHKNKLLSLG
ncbi:patatin-like phospholipase family protein [Longitalea arenae]|uniref:patatin-like phospholipase family protein n=1 Tax=Longitalea arenae TaxID=2812558 RepID=UPI0019681A5E|nr:patatin-like phospholipase family protein [Longitalea arenae]